jgi:pimeloyl-ACP methyl ester carboxylesterase
MKMISHLFRAGLVFGLIQNACAQPTVPTPPQNQTVIAGTTARFTVGATGAEPLSYQWRSYVNLASFTNIPFATEAVLALTNVQPTTRRFAVIVTDSAGLSVTSSPLVSLTVLGITSQPTNQMVDLGTTVTFTVAASGGATVPYQWRFEGADLPGQTTPSLLLTNAQLTNAGSYSVVVSYAIGSVTSRVALLVFTTVHQIEDITANHDHTISLNLKGVVPNLFAAYYDVYPIEASTNLEDWSPVAILQRTNVSFDALGCSDTAATNFAKRFYRTPTNFLITPFPKPSGPYPVGTVSRLLTDPTRIRNTTPPTNSLMVTFWYPAEALAGILPASYVENEITLVPPASGAPSYWNSPVIVAKFISQSLPNLPLATNRISYPVVIFSHGMGGHRRQNTDTVVELASHGYVVVAMDHKDAFASLFPGGQVVRGAPGTPCEGLDTSVVDYRTHDLVFVMDELGRLNTQDALLAGRLDLEKLGVIGKSMGGMAVAEFGRMDARCQAVVLLDAGYTLEMPPDLLRLGLQKPFLSMSSTMDRPLCSNFSEWLSASLALFTNAVSEAFWCQIQNSTHNGFFDKASLINDAAGTGHPTAASRAQSLPIRACTVSFFDKYLKGEDDHLLDNPAAVYPNIINFQSK